MEELGELCEQTLLQGKLQRSEKLHTDESALANEFADILITTLLLAENMSIDVIKALEDKIEKIKGRTY